MAKTKLQCYILAAGFVFLAVSVGLIYRITTKENTVQYRGYITAAFWIIVTAFPILSTCLLAAICFDIFFVKCSQHFTVAGLLMIYTLQRVMAFSGIFLKRKLLNKLQDPRGTQEALLKEWMANNADSAYGKRYKFRQIKSLQDLKDKHPLTDYSHYEKYVDRMANGEPNVLICEDIHRFGITSGTTGKGKLIPMTKSRMPNMMSMQAILLTETNKAFGSVSPLQKQTMLYVNPRPFETPSGHLVGPMNLLTDDMKVIVSNMHTTPWEAKEISTEFEAIYIGILFSLRDRDVGLFMGPFSFTVYKAMILMENNWRKFIFDIETGTIDKDLAISENVRTACENALSPDPKRAAELRQEFEKGFEGIMGRIWPHMKWIMGVNTANFTEKLQAGYGKGVPIYTPMYSSTEGDYGLNLWPRETPRYVLLPNSVIYEFIPEKEMSDKDPTTLFIDDVKKGQNYEMVVCTSGFYRYRFGDVIKVVDIYQKTPVVEFMYRSGQLLNLRAEKVTEISVDEAVHHMTSNITGATLNCWTSAESTLLTKIEENDEFDGSAQFYLIFVELEGEDDIHSVLGDDYEQQIDNALKERNNYYKGYRNAGTISPPRVFFVKKGSFNALRDLIVASTTASYNQFKVPRKLKTKETLELMLKHRI